MEGCTLCVGENMDNLYEDRKLSVEARRGFHTPSPGRHELGSQCLKGMCGVWVGLGASVGVRVMPSGVGEILDPMVCTDLPQVQSLYLGEGPLLQL